MKWAVKSNLSIVCCSFLTFDWISFAKLKQQGKYLLPLLLSSGLSCWVQPAFPCSDPEPLLDLSGGISQSSSIARGGMASHGARYRRDDVTLIKRGLSSESGNLLRPSRVAAVEQWARQTGGPRANLIARRGSECSGGNFCANLLITLTNRLI
jgi:hypothetical protein